MFLDWAIALFGGFLGGLGGAAKSSKAYRRWGIPLLLTGYALFLTRLMWIPSLYAMLLVPILHMGYGRAAPDDAHPSMLGRIFKDTGAMADIFIRGSICTLAFLTFVPIALYSRNWGMFAGVYAFCLSVFVVFGGDSIIRREGYFFFYGMTILWEDIIIYTTLCYSFIRILRGG